MHRCCMCAEEAPGWFDRCPGCDRWGTCVERPPRSGSGLPWLAEVSPGRDRRLALREDWDEVLGGGAPAGSVTLVSGAAGGGKTTDLLDLAGRAGRRGRAPALYLSSERSLRELSAQAREARLDVRRVKACEVRELGEALERALEGEWSLACLDSWSALRGADPAELEALRGTGVTFFVICHVTKDGSLAGREELVHRADAHVELEPGLLRAAKNWHGPQGLEVVRRAPCFT